MRESRILPPETCKVLAKRAFEVSALVRASDPMSLAAVVEGYDLPLVYVSDAFLWMTGYERSDCIGKNCRFLQGKYTAASAIAQIRQAIKEESNCMVKLINYRKDGTPFVNGFRLGKSFFACPLQICVCPFLFRGQC